MKYRCTFYTVKNTSTTDMLFGEVSQDIVEKALSLERDSEIELNVKITGAHNLVGGSEFWLRQKYLEVFIENAFFLDEVVVADIVREEILPINTMIKIKGFTRF